MILKYKNGHFYLSKPLGVSQKTAISWLESLSLSQYQKLMSASKVKLGDDFVYLFGKKYLLDVSKNQNISLLLKQQLKEYAIMRIAELNLVNFDVKVEVQNMTSKFGCCFYTQQRIKLATRLVHEPKEVIDSIIIHELAHFYYPNHQKEFYQFVYQHCPNYRVYERFLKSGGVGDDPICE